MRPYITCYMYASLDGHIDCNMTEKIDPASKPYYDVLEQFGDITNINGRITRYTHDALPSLFKSYSGSPCGQAFYKACSSDSYEVSFDTNGSLMWGQSSLKSKPLLCVVSENAPQEYVDYLKGKGISFIACGKGKIDIPVALDIMFNEFGVKKALLTGGGHINSAFIDEKLIDEIWMMYGPGIDGRKGFTCAFDGRGEISEPFVLKLNDVSRLENDTVLLKYKV